MLKKKTHMKAFDSLPHSEFHGNDTYCGTLIKNPL